MNIWSKSSLGVRADAHTELQLLFDKVLQVMDCTLLCSYRNEAAQELAFSEGRTKLHYPHGNHNQKPSMAMDVAPTPIDWNNREKFILFAGIVKGIASRMYECGDMKYRIRWGGDWDGTNNLNPKGKGILDDLPHFELIK